MSSVVIKRDKSAGDVDDLDWDSSVIVDTDDQPLLYDECKQRRKHHSSCKVCLVVLVLLLFLLVLFPLVYSVLSVSCDAKSKFREYRHAAVASNAAPCSRIGKEVLKQNGSAVDAAIASLFCLGVLNAQNAGIGGGFHMVVYDRLHGESVKQTWAFDARERAPASSSEHMFDNITDDVFGGVSVAVPGEVAGYHEAWKRFGRLPWRRLLQPTIDMCRRGYRVTWALAHDIRKKERVVRENPSLRQQFVKSDGSLFREGDIMYNRKLADTLDLIASDDGVWDMYNGSLARRIIDDLHDIGANITMSDLSQYRVHVYPALSMSLRGGLSIHTLRPPSSGAILAFMLRVLGGFNFTSSTQSDVDTLQKIVETFKFGYALRSYLGDELFVNVSEIMHNLTSWSFANYIRRRIDVNRTHDIGYYHPSFAPRPLDAGTTHLSIQSPDGAAVAVTSTVNSYFGSHRIGARTGILFNDEMNDFHSPMTTSANRVAPGKRPQSSMCPAIILDPHQDVVMVIGASGAARITSATAYVAAHKLYFGTPIHTAVDVPRLHHQLVPDLLQHEQCFDKLLLEGLEKKGHVVVRLKEVATVQAIFNRCRHRSSSADRTYSVDDRCLVAVSDWRKRGAPSGF